MIRWFQFGTFVPIFRVHGSESQTEYWHYGSIVEKYVLLVDNLRYRLLPYIYSMAFKITTKSFTLQRPIVMDFNNDINIYGINIINNTIVTFDHEFMFGDSLLIVPVYNDNNKTNIYLPQSQPQSNLIKWYDFWTGNTFNTSTFMLNKHVELNNIPIFVKSGSILIMGPFVQFGNQIAWIELEIRIYQGNDGVFTLYEDDGEYVDSISQDKYSLIDFRWFEMNKTLQIGARQGMFNGMIDQNRIFNIVLVSQNHGVGVNVTDTQTVDKIVTYDGTQQWIAF